MCGICHGHISFSSDQEQSALLMRGRYSVPAQGREKWPCVVSILVHSSLVLVPI